MSAAITIYYTECQLKYLHGTYIMSPRIILMYCYTNCNSMLIGRVRFQNCNGWTVE